MFAKIVSAINDIVWSPALVVLLIFAGIYFSIRTGFVQVRRFGLMLKSLFSRRDKKDSHGISSFQAFCVALSGRVGTGNIVGVATAIALGGPGSVFWMWIIAFFGASTAFVESTLAQIYKFKHSTGYRGGPSNYIQHGLGLKWLGILFSIIAVTAFSTMLTTVQSNGISSALGNSYGLSPLVSGLILAFILGLVIIGGIKSISKVASVVTPFMALGYVLISIVVIILHIHDVPAVVGSIVTNAFGIRPVAGGILGSTIMMGVKRGIFSNEAGQGSGAIVSASADVPHPVKQGLAQSFSVYVDTLLVCTATALMILCSGTYNILESSGNILVENAPELADNYVGYTQAALDSVMSGFGNQFVTIALFFFVFTTVMAYYFYSESSIMYMFDVRGKGGSKAEKVCVWALRIIILASTVFGAVRETNVVWTLGDIGVGLMAWVNVVTLLILCPKAIRALKDYESRLRRGESEPVYRPDASEKGTGAWKTE